MPPGGDLADLHRSLRSAREAILWKLDGLGEYDLRRPLVPTGTNLLGLVKHLACGEAGYLGAVFSRPLADFPFAWGSGDDADDDPNADLYATAAESSALIVRWYQTACRHADETIAELGGDGLGTVPWWPADRNPVTVTRVVAHLLAETSRHLGQADIIRELIDGSTGLRPGVSNLPERDGAWWASYRDKVEHLARQAADADR